MRPLIRTQEAPTTAALLQRAAAAAALQRALLGDALGAADLAQGLSGGGAEAAGGFGSTGPVDGRAVGSPTAVWLPPPHSRSRRPAPGGVLRADGTLELLLPAEASRVRWAVP
jgi:hypothetical protein